LRLSEQTDPSPRPSPLQKGRGSPKRPSESFTRTIDRLVEAANNGTCADAVNEAASIWQAIGNDEEADRMEQFVRERRESAGWDVERRE
jgi:hypothetical protein